MKIILGVANPYRDLKGVILLAMYLCNRGATCYVMPWGVVRRTVWKLMPDFVLMGHMRRSREEFTRQLLEASIKVGVLDDEGGVVGSLEKYTKSIVTDDSIRHNLTCFCSWGTKLANYLVENGYYERSQVTITGCPRFDFYVEPWRDAALVTSKYVDIYPRPIVLINGLYPMANNAYMTIDKIIKAQVRNLSSQNENEVLHKYKLSLQGMKEMVELANYLAFQFPDVTFVYRPHPDEKMETYFDLLDNAPNLYLSKQGTIDGWILRSIAIIQRRCSTAIDASLAVVPALSPMWIPTPEIMNNAEAVSLQCATRDELVNKLNMIIEGQLRKPIPIQETTNRVIADWFYANDGMAHQRVGDCIISNIENNRKQFKRPIRRNRSRLNIYFNKKKVKIFKDISKVKSKVLISSHPNTIRNIDPRKTYHSDLHFDADEVKTIVDAISCCAQSKYKDNWHTIVVESLYEHGDYDIGDKQDYYVKLFSL